MTAKLKRTWEMLDGSLPIGSPRVMVEPGQYTLERVANPHGFAAPWLVLRGTTIGMAEGAWREWEDEIGDWQIVIEAEAARKESSSS